MLPGVSPIPSVQLNASGLELGVPEYLRLRWKALKQKLTEEESLPPFHNIVLRLKLKDETQIASALNTVTQQTGPEIQIGSYPVEISILFSFCPTDVGCDRFRIRKMGPIPWSVWKARFSRN